VRNERQRRAYTPDDVRARLHDRHAALTEPPEPAQPPAVVSRSHRFARLLRRR
jgi:hypothetical protein